MPIPAHFDTTSTSDATPRDARRRLLLEAQGVTAAGDASPVLVHNISTTGLLLESAQALAPGERIEIELPQAGATAAEVVWSSGNLFGCRFDAPVGSATLSAAQLRGAAHRPVRLEPVPRDDTIGPRLLRLRQERGLTLAQVAAALGVSKPTVWAWEQGRARPIANRIDALADVLGVAPSELQAPAEGDAGLRDLLARSREQIAIAAGARPDQVRILIEL